MTGYATIGVAGAGAWGTALANTLARAGRRVILWARHAPQAAALERDGENRSRLPGLRLDPAVAPSAALADLAAAEAVLIAVPAQSMRALSSHLAPAIGEACPVIVTAKGIERETQCFMTEVVAQTLPRSRPAILSGPSFAKDVAAGLPTAVVIAAAAPDLATELASALTSPTLRLYHTTDMRGVEIGGAAKNVLAIAAGIVEGSGLGDSAKAALTARGFAELRRFASAFGARPETLMGLGPRRPHALDLDAEIAQFRVRSRARARRAARDRRPWRARGRRLHGGCARPHGASRRRLHADLRGGRRDPRGQALHS